MMRLDRYLVTLGVGTRTEVQKLIRAGGVEAEGAVCRDPGQQLREGASLRVHGEALDTRLMRHVMLNKPAGLLTAARDRKQPTVMDLLPPAYAALGCMPVGRLDKDTTGLLLLSCDGELNHRLLSPARLEILSSSAAESVARVTVREGKFHQIKRMFEAVGRQVMALHREAFGPLTLDATLAPGQWRELTAEEASALYEAAQMEVPQ